MRGRALGMCASELTIQKEIIGMKVMSRIEHHDLERPINLHFRRVMCSGYHTASYLRGSWANSCSRRPNRDGPDDRCVGVYDMCMC